MTAPPEGTLSARRRIRLSYADTDAAGIIYFAAWFPWMERLSTEWFHDNGFRFDQMLARFGATMVSRATSCEYLVPVGVYDEVDIEMRVARVGESSCQLAFAMTRVADARAVGRSTLTLVAVDASGRATSVPDALRDLLTA
jgi:YbgC/YbaW family acyl-CoA thioester hydrolase